VICFDHAELSNVVSDEREVVSGIDSHHGDAVV
jgi:hypothetical protein